MGFDFKNPMFWLKIIKFIIELILEGTSVNNAVSMASTKFGVSESDIWKYGGDKIRKAERKIK